MFLKTLLTALVLGQMVIIGGPAKPLRQPHTLFYVDPDYAGGTRNGQASTPWQSLTDTVTNTPWTVINDALSSGPVTVYFSARDAGADTNDVLAADINITSKTANPIGTLTLNGRSLYNTNDATPSWTAHTGAGRAQVQSVVSQNAAHTKYNRWTVDGLTIVRSGGGKGISICGDDVTIQNADISHPSGVTSGPLVLIVPTADGAHEGSSDWCPASSNITIQDSVIHDSYGELIYVGGAGCTDNASPDLGAATCDGFPSHSDITIAGNTIYNCGSRTGGEGDCIDVKAAITNMTISQNDISAAGEASVEVRALVIQGIQTDGTDQNILIERNYVHDIAFVRDGAIALVNSWGTPNGVTIRNNVIDTLSSGHAINVSATQAAGVKLFSNTVYNVSGFCMSTGGGSIVEAKNNICLTTNGGGAPNSFTGGSVATATHNAYSGTWSGTCTSCVSGLTTAAMVDAAGGDFQLASDSAALNVGTTLASFSIDYAGITRPQGVAWDIGAYERVP